MSATLGMLLKQLNPAYSIKIFERLDKAAAESSDAWNNAGTGHSAFCELNYTPQKADGSIPNDKAVKIAEQFEVSKQFWAYLVEHQLVSLPQDFIRPIPHMSFVWGKENVAYLKKRHQSLTESHLFKGMEYSEDHATIQQWVPLMMQARPADQPIAATKMDIGTDVNFGALTRCMFQTMQQMDGVEMHFNQEVQNIKKTSDGHWFLDITDENTGERRNVVARFIFIGAGGGSLPLLLKTGIPEGKGFGGFPVSGQWLRCTNEAVIAAHDAKVYGKASVGSPPMSVPHLDTRIINGKKELLFGPYAGFTTKFLKKGSFFDLLRSIRLANIIPMLAAGWHNIPLTKYLIKQVRQSPEDRLEALRDFVPDARMDDWELEIAGQRVQVIKKDEKQGGILEFGTEVVSAADGSVAALLGASPGASTAVSIMLTLLERCFGEELKTEAWQQQMRRMVPSYGRSLAKEPGLLEELRNWSSAVLKLSADQPVTA